MCVLLFGCFLKRAGGGGGGGRAGGGGGLTAFDCFVDIQNKVTEAAGNSQLQQGNNVCLTPSRVHSAKTV